MSAFQQRPPTTTDAGIPVASQGHSLTVGPDGPILLLDFYLIEQMANFNRERIPERRVSNRKGERTDVDPQELSSVSAAPLLCAGLTTFSALRNSPAKASELVAVIGVGGLGHLAVQYGRYFGFEVVAIDRGEDRAELAKGLGAHHYVDSTMTNVAETLRDLGGASVVLATASGGNTVEQAIKGLRPGKF